MMMTIRAYLANFFSHSFSINAFHQIFLGYCKAYLAGNYSLSYFLRTNTQCSKIPQKLSKTRKTIWDFFLVIFKHCDILQQPLKKGRENNRVSLGYSPIFGVKWSDGAGIKSLLEVGLFPLEGIFCYQHKRLHGVERIKECHSTLDKIVLRMIEWRFYKVPNICITLD